jgi:hypothetical protein
MRIGNGFLKLSPWLIAPAALFLGGPPVGAGLFDCRCKNQACPPYHSDFFGYYATDWRLWPPACPALPRPPAPEGPELAVPELPRVTSPPAVPSPPPPVQKADWQAPKPAAPKPTGPAYVPTPGSPYSSLPVVAPDPAGSRPGKDPPETGPK